jgi:hypothetical protein
MIAPFDGSISRAYGPRYNTSLPFGDPRMTKMQPWKTCAELLPVLAAMLALAVGYCPAGRALRHAPVALT